MLCQEIANQKGARPMKLTNYDKAYKSVCVCVCGGEYVLPAFTFIFIHVQISTRSNAHAVR